eukprot:TRINITY_DN533_c0_g1_i1.p1 TRINITY_DN533_c0_g1~~TRINITY_DN533_c0_g1_i1.p1  ORF type:complete len:499 (-),score=149.73 TRINITY_DN533_c0_g1_i1:55-1551(-)
MCIRDRYQRRVRGTPRHAHGALDPADDRTHSSTSTPQPNTTAAMGLGDIFTNLCCRSGPKSPPCPSPDKSDTARKAAANANEKTIVEVLPGGDTPGPASPNHAGGFSVNQVRKVDGKARVKVEEETDEPRQKLILDAFGFEVQRMLNSKAWDDRAQALAAAKEKCHGREIPEGVDEAMFLDACCKLVVISMQDKVMPIYFDGLELCKFFFDEFFGTFECAQEVVNINLEQLLPMIIAKTADRNARSNEGTRSILCFLAKCPLVGCSPVMAHIFSPIVNFKEISAIRGRLEMIDHLIDSFGFGKSSTITMQLVMGFVRPHLDATDEKVRRAAIEVTVNCYKHKGDRTAKYITNVKPALLKLLEQRFAELDKPARGSRKHAKSAQGLPAVRGKPRIQLPKRESSSQPCGNTTDPFCPMPLPSEPTALGNVLNDCPQLFSMGPSNVVGTPQSSQANVGLSSSMREEAPNFIGSPEMPGSMPRMGGGAEDLDADLMDEIEGY